jgi:hypothetical protein
MTLRSPTLLDLGIFSRPQFGVQRPQRLLASISGAALHPGIADVAQAQCRAAGAPETAQGPHTHAQTHRPGVTDSRSPPPEVEPAEVWHLRAAVARSRCPACAMASAEAGNVVWLLLGSTALWLSLLGAGTVSASKAVTAHLAAKWPETPLLLEARWVAAPRGGLAGVPGLSPGTRRRSEHTCLLPLPCPAPPRSLCGSPAPPSRLAHFPLSTQYFGSSGSGVVPGT